MRFSKGILSVGQSLLLSFGAAVFGESLDEVRLLTKNLAFEKAGAAAEVLLSQATDDMSRNEAAYLVFLNAIRNDERERGLQAAGKIDKKSVLIQEKVIHRLAQYGYWKDAHEACDKLIAFSEAGKERDFALLLKLDLLIGEGDKQKVLACYASMQDAKDLAGAKVSLFVGEPIGFSVLSRNESVMFFEEIFSLYKNEKDGMKTLLDKVEACTSDELLRVAQVLNIYVPESDQAYQILKQREGEFSDNKNYDRLRFISALHCGAVDVKECVRFLKSAESSPDEFVDAASMVGLAIASADEFESGLNSFEREEKRILSALLKATKVDFAGAIKDLSGESNRWQEDVLFVNLLISQDRLKEATESCRELMQKHSEQKQWFQKKLVWLLRGRRRFEEALTEHRRVAGDSAEDAAVDINLLWHLGRKKEVEAQLSSSPAEFFSNSASRKVLGDIMISSAPGELVEIGRNIGTTADSAEDVQVARIFQRIGSEAVEGRISFADRVLYENDSVHDLLTLTLNISYPFTRDTVDVSDALQRALTLCALQPEMKSLLTEYLYHEAASSAFFPLLKEDDLEKKARSFLMSPPPVGKVDDRLLLFALSWSEAAEFSLEKHMEDLEFEKGLRLAKAAAAMNPDNWKLRFYLNVFREERGELKPAFYDFLFLKNTVVDDNKGKWGKLLSASSLRLFNFPVLERLRSLQMERWKTYQYRNAQNGMILQTPFNTVQVSEASFLIHGGNCAGLLNDQSRNGVKAALSAEGEVFAESCAEITFTALGGGGNRFPSTGSAALFGLLQRINGQAVDFDKDQVFADLKELGNDMAGMFALCQEADAKQFEEALELFRKFTVKNQALLPLVVSSFRLKEEKRNKLAPVLLDALKTKDFRDFSSSQLYFQVIKFLGRVGDSYPELFADLLDAWFRDDIQNEKFVSNSIFGGVNYFSGPEDLIEGLLGNIHVVFSRNGLDRLRSLISSTGWKKIAEHLTSNKAKLVTAYLADDKDLFDEMSLVNSTSAVFVLTRSLFLLKEDEKPAKVAELLSRINGVDADDSRLIDLVMLKMGEKDSEFCKTNFFRSAAKRFPAFPMNAVERNALTGILRKTDNKKTAERFERKAVGDVAQKQIGRTTIRPHDINNLIQQGKIDEAVELAVTCVKQLAGPSRYFQNCISTLSNWRSGQLQEYVLSGGLADQVIDKLDSDGDVTFEKCFALYLFHNPEALEVLTDFMTANPDHEGIKFLLIMELAEEDEEKAVALLKDLLQKKVNTNYLTGIFSGNMDLRDRVNLLKVFVAYGV